MNRVSIPLAIGLLLIISLSFVEGNMRDRWGTPEIEAAEFGKRFEKVPKTIGNWEGEDLPVEEVTRKTAGAVSYVSRRYTNSRTQQAVNLWLIVGHSRDIVRHTPVLCYPSQGFRQIGSPLKHHIDVPGEESAEFYTATFSKEDPSGRHMERVFWAWNHPDINKWEAPDSARIKYGLARALYKMYFVGSVSGEENTVDSSATVKFAKLMLPALNDALFPEESIESGGEPNAEISDAESSDTEASDTE